MVSTKFHLDRIFLNLYGFFLFFRLTKLVLLSFRGYLDETQSEKTKRSNFLYPFFYVQCGVRVARPIFES